MEYALQTKDLAKRYRKQQVLKSISMNVKRGAIYGLIGKNGAGKTTIIRIITGLQRPNAGIYSLFGVQNDNKSIYSARRRVGAVVETPSIYLGMSAYDNLKQQAIVLGLPSYESINEVLKLVGLENTGKKKAKNFSLGMKQRLGIGIALMGNPDLLVLDEPLNGLDPQGIIEMRELILKLSEEKNITFIISSHILSELERLATDYGFVNKGTIVEEISAAELEKKCKKRMDVVVSDIKSFARVIDGFGLPFEIHSDTEASILGEMDVSDLVIALDKEKCKLHKITENNETLESYFIKIVGEETAND